MYPQDMSNIRGTECFQWEGFLFSLKKTEGGKELTFHFSRHSFALLPEEENHRRETVPSVHKGLVIPSSSSLPPILSQPEL